MSRSPGRRRGPSVAFDGQNFTVENGGRRLIVPAVREGEDEWLVPLDDVTKWEGGEELAVEDLQRILEAIEEEADELGLSISFD